MDFYLSEEQRVLCHSVIEFARKGLNNDLLELDHAGNFPRSAWDRCAEFGIQGLPIPEQFGGQGADLVTTTLVMESLGYGCRDNGLLLSINAHLWCCALPIWKFGNDMQRARYLPGLCNGSLIGGQAVTEPDSGSDAMAISTAAVPDGDHYILNGTKTYITNAPIASILTVLTRIDAGEHTGELATFIVERNTPGLGISKPFNKLGLHTSPMGDVTFTDCRVPASSLLGAPGAGMAAFTSTADWERGFILATALGTMRRQVEESVDYATSHRRFGRPIGKNQAVANRIVDMRVRLDASRLLMYHLAWLKDQGKRTVFESAIVKLFLSDAFVNSSTAAFETFGAQGYMVGNAQEREVRDSLASRIYSGTSDIQRVIIARMLGL